MLPADELASLMETAHLLRSPRNATRLLSALRRALGDDRVLPDVATMGGEDFSLYEDSKRQAIQNFSRETNLPLSSVQPQPSWSPSRRWFSSVRA